MKKLAKNKKIAIVGGIVTYTNMEESSPDLTYRITEETCQLCYEIFGNRTKEQCLKCREGALKD